jgi:SAM-dependent methyltransferase
MPVHHAAAEGFARNAGDYERTRPTYPQAAVDHLVGELGLGPGRTVVDVGAGTGKLTRLLVATGARVVAVEPVAEMRTQLAAAAPDAVLIEGTAERLPLEAGSVDAVTVAQAMHWFDGPAALAEFARVLRPGGAVAVVYNRRDGRVDWVRAVGEIVDAHRGDTPRGHQGGSWREAFEETALFGPLEEASFENHQTLTPEEVVGRWRSISFVGAMDPARQAEVLGEVAALVATHPDTAGKSEIVIPHNTIVSVCRRL